MNWQKLNAGLGSITKNVQGLDLSSAGGKLTKGFSNLQQTIRETTGAENDVTVLPDEYLALERRVDALKSAHTNFLKVTKCYDVETYDYPTQIQESFTEISQNIGHSVSLWASKATKGTSLPQPAIVDKAPAQHKTLPHALSRAAASGSATLESTQQSDHLAKALKMYAVAMDKIGTARLEQDAEITANFNAAWSVTNTQISAANRARANVKAARLSLDACRNRSKHVTGSKAEQMRLEIEQAEENLVNATEEAIGLMRGVLESPASLSALAALTKAQQAFYAKSAEILAGIQGDIEDAATEAEGEYRKSRA